MTCVHQSATGDLRAHQLPRSWRLTSILLSIYGAHGLQVGRPLPSAQKIIAVSGRLLPEAGTAQRDDLIVPLYLIRWLRQ